MSAFRARVVGLAVAALVLGFQAPAASAEGPSRVELPPLEFLTTGCGFPVMVESVQQPAQVLDWGDHFILAGVLKVRLTNLDTGTSIEVNISGAEQGEITEGGFRESFEGRTLVSIEPGDEALVGIAPGLYLTTGLLILEVIFEPETASITHVGGTWTGLCPALA